MNSREYLLQLFSRAAFELSSVFAKKTIGAFQEWIENEKLPAIGLLSMASSPGETKSLISFDLNFVIVAGANYDPTEEELIVCENDAEELTNSFRYLIDNSPYINISQWNATETFRDDSYNGIGKGLSMTIQIRDSQDYCYLKVDKLSKECDG